MTRAALAPRVRILGGADLAEAQELLSQDPVTDVVVASRIDAVGIDSWRLGAEVWGHEVDGRLVALAYAGANLWPVRVTPVSAAAFANRARRQGRRCASIVGPAAAVLELWRLLEPAWGPAREVRTDQPLLLIDRPPTAAADPAVRLVQPGELDVVLPACIAMHTEEIGVRPDVGEGRALYRARVAELIRGGRCYARIEDGRVLFKAEVGAATAAACQVQGVWVDPALRGSGLGTAGTAAVVAAARARIAPVVSLYVNAYNTTARKAYARVGFEQVGTFASVLF